MPLIYFLYLLHLWISLRFGKGASISVGVAGSLVAALMLTGLGEGIWYFIPWGWGVRFCDMAVIKSPDSPGTGRTRVLSRTKIPWDGWLSGCATLFLFALCLLWFKRLGGEKRQRIINPCAPGHKRLYWW